MIREGTRVSWAWGNGRAEGVVVERHEATTRRTIDGTEVRRNGSADDPALVIRQDDDQDVLKLRSEVERCDGAG